MFSDQIIHEVWNSWNVDQERWTGVAKVSPLDLEVIRVMLQTLFLTSIKQEEGEFVDCSVTFFPQTQWEGFQQERLSKYGKNRNNTVYSFSSRLPFTESVLSKLGDAFDSNQSSLLVQKAADDSAFEIWGVYFHFATNSKFEDWPPSTQYGMGGYDDFWLLMRIVAPGTIDIIRSDRYKIGTFVSGNYYLSEPTPLNNQALGKFLRVHSDQLSPSHETKDIFFKLYQLTIEDLIMKIPKRSRGASLIVVPEYFDKQYLKTNRSLTNTLSILEIMVEFTNQSQNLIKNPSDSVSQSLRTGLKHNLKYRLDILAQMASVDGALVITDKFELVSFGAKLDAPPYEEEVNLGPIGFGIEREENSFNLKAYGTRHRSVASFVASCPDSIGFVFSEDGPVRGFAESDGQLLCWPDCRMTKFA